MRTQAAVLTGADAPLSIVDVEIEAPRPNEVLVRTVAVGVCGTDLEFGRHFPTPGVLGHEGAGVVEQVGAHVTSVAPGDHVVMAYSSCGGCRRCLTGTPSYCREFDALNFTGRRPDGSTALSMDGEPVNGHFLGQSAFAAHVVAPERAVVRVDPAIDLTVAAPFGCGLQTGAGAVLNVLRPPAGSSIAVLGAGAVGSAAIMAAALVGCSTIVAVDVAAGKLDAARGFGATHVVDSSVGDVAEQLGALAPDGLDFVIDTTGREQVLRAGVDALGPLGHAGVVGVGPSESMSFEWLTFLNGRTVSGIISSATVPQVFVPQLLALHAAGRFPAERMFSYFPFERINDALEAARTGAVAKAVLTF